jgi:hypothetical protein
MPTALPILFNNPLDLDKIDVASPCHARWEDMVGSDRVRFCGSCQKNVFNLSGMKRDEASELLRATDGKLCVRFFRRQDGTILTQDCPVGIALVVRRAKRATLIAAATTIGAIATMLTFLGLSMTKKAGCELQNVKTQIEEVIPEITPPIPTMGEPPPLMGDVAPPPQPPKPIQKMGKVKRPVEVKGGLG